MTTKRTIKRKAYLLTLFLVTPRVVLFLSGIPCHSIELIAFTLSAIWLSFVFPNQLTPERWEFEWLSYPNKARKFIERTLLLTAKHTTLSMPVIWYLFTTETEKESLLSKGSPTLLVLTYLILIWYLCLFINTLMLYRRQHCKARPLKK